MSESFFSSLNDFEKSENSGFSKTPITNPVVPQYRKCYIQYENDAVLVCFKEDVSNKENWELMKLTDPPPKQNQGGRGRKGPIELSAKEDQIYGNSGMIENGSEGLYISRKVKDVLPYHCDNPYSLLNGDIFLLNIPVYHVARKSNFNKSVEDSITKFSETHSKTEQWQNAYFDEDSKTGYEQNSRGKHNQHPTILCLGEQLKDKHFEKNRAGNLYFCCTYCNPMAFYSSFPKYNPNAQVDKWGDFYVSVTDNPGLLMKAENYIRNAKPVENSKLTSDVNLFNDRFVAQLYYGHMPGFFNTFCSIAEKKGTETFLNPQPFFHDSLTRTNLLMHFLAMQYAYMRHETVDNLDEDKFPNHNLLTLYRMRDGKETCAISTTPETLPFTALSLFQQNKSLTGKLFLNAICGPKKEDQFNADHSFMDLELHKKDFSTSNS